MGSAHILKRSSVAASAQALLQSRWHKALLSLKGKPAASDNYAKAKHSGSVRFRGVLLLRIITFSAYDLELVVIKFR